MNKIILNMRYKMRFQITCTAWYLGIYVITMLLVYHGLIKYSIINQGNGSLFYRIWGLVIFYFAISMIFKENYDYLLTLGSTRKEIFYSSLGVSLGFSTFFSGLIVLERLVVDYLNNAFGYNNISDLFHFFAPYRTDNYFLQFIFFFMLCACCSTSGLLLGSLFYRLGEKFIFAFWLMFSFIIMMLLTPLVWNFYLIGRLSNFNSAMLVFLKNFNVLTGSGYLLILSIIFSIAAYLNIRRLPQK